MTKFLAVDPVTAIRMSLLLLSVAVSPPVVATNPEKRDPDSYAGLWTNSPFTEEQIRRIHPDVNPIEGYTLAVVAETQAGWFVILINKKNREERVRIMPWQKNAQGFQVIEVVQDPLDYMSTKVRIRYKEHTAVVGYDRRFLAPTPAKHAAEMQRHVRSRRVPVPPR